MVSANVRGSKLGVDGVVSRGEGVDVFLLQEIPLGVGGECYGVNGYIAIGGVGGIGGGGDGDIGKGTVVGMLVDSRWGGKMVIIKRERCKIGLRLDLGGGRKLEVWCIYVGKGKHREFEWVEGDGDVVVMGDVNARSELWGGDGIRREWEGCLVEEWMDRWGFKLGTPRGVITRVGQREGERGNVLDIGVGVGGLSMVGKVWEGIVGMDHRPVEMVVEMLGVVVEGKEEKKGCVDWGRLGGLLEMEGEWERWLGRLGEGGRNVLEEVVEEVEGWLERMVESCRSEKRWDGGRRRWWTKRVEGEFKRVRGLEKSWEEEGGRERKREMERGRIEFRRVVEEEKGEYWGKYLEEVGINEAFKWVKNDRDFVVDVPDIRGEDGRMVGGDEEKGVAIVRGLGKREQLMQEEEGEVFEVDLDEEEVEGCVFKQSDKRAPGENGLGGKVIKSVWGVKGGRRWIMGVYRKSLGLGYVCKRWRRSVGIVMRKPNKPDYSLPSSYRVINLLDVLGKGLERVVCGRLGEWCQLGMGDEQYGARSERSSLEAVGGLVRDWEEGGGVGLLLCMDVMGGYENVGVGKMEERLVEVGVDGYLRKWVSSFLREREVVVKIGGRLGKGVLMKGGTVQGSPLSPLLFMFLLGGVLEEVRREGVEGVSVVAVVDDVDFMVVGKSRREIKERVGRMEVGLKRGLEKWEVDVQKLKLEGVWMKKGRIRWMEEVNWLGEEIKMKWSTRVLGVWMQGDGGWKSHVDNRLRIAEGRWRMLLRMLGKKGRGMSVKNLCRMYRAVVEKAMMYGMEVFWDGQVGLKERLQVWINRGLRRILGAVGTTPVDVMLGEVGWKRVEYELDKRVDRWGMRIMRRGEGKGYGVEWRRLEEERRGLEGGGLLGRLLRRVGRQKLEGERWEVERERDGRVGWSVRGGEGKLVRKKEWEEERLGRERDYLGGVSDASKEGGRVGMGGGLWEGGRCIRDWRIYGGMGLTVEEGEMGGVGEVLRRVLGEYKGTKRMLVVGVDNKGVVERLRKGRGYCSELEGRVREWGRRLLDRGWSVRVEWVPGHVGVEENELVDEWAKEAVWEEEEGDMGDILCWGEWESRRKAEECRKWKEFWIGERKGEEYFGSGGDGGELGHGGKRWESRMLVWLRSGHGAMGAARYRKELGFCDCGGLDDRDHFLLYCKKWEEERKEIWKGWWGGVWAREGWVDVERMMFSEDGVKRLLEFGRRTGWKDRVWKGGRWGG